MLTASTKPSFSQLRAELDLAQQTFESLSRDYRNFAEELRQEIYTSLVSLLGFKKVVPETPGFVDAVEKDGIEVSLIAFCDKHGLIRIDFGIPISSVEVKLSDQERANFRFVTCGTKNFLNLRNLYVDEESSLKTIIRIKEIFENAKEILARKGLQDEIHQDKQKKPTLKKAKSNRSDAKAGGK